MRIHDVIRRKGGNVVTVRPDTDVTELLGVLAEHGIGAVVVTPGGEGPEAATILGIVSERDVVRRLHRDGTAVLTAPVSDLMTAEVHTCTPDDQLPDVASTMTEHRVRHLPVVRDGSLVAIVSIGDVVKQRIEQLQDENEQLSGYIRQ